MKKLIVGNWKMNGPEALLYELAEDLDLFFENDDALSESCDFLICPAFPYLISLATLFARFDHVAVGAQDCSRFDAGSYTGDVSAMMIKDAGCRYVILGHSERRHLMGENDADVKAKAERAHDVGLVPIICVGETEEERETGREQEVVGAQIAACLPDKVMSENIVIAYEPVWAIGTGKTATPDDVKSMHAFIREVLKEKVEDFDKVRILYGGSMKPKNAFDLLATENVDGGLIGGASLKVEDFIAIAKAVKS